METLAVVAYRQPVLRAQIEAVRGVQCGEILRQLMERELVRIVGRSEDLGRPFLYGTTKQFLEVFGLRHLDELPRPALTRAAADGPRDGPAEPLDTGAGAETPSQPIHLSLTEGGSNVTTAPDAVVPSQETLEEHSPALIEDDPSEVLNMDEDYDDLEDEDFEDEDDYDEDYDDEDYDDEDEDDEDYDEDDEDLEEDEDFEDDEWEEVEDDEEEDDEEDEDWDDEDWDEDEDEEDEEDEDWDDEEDEDDEDDDWD
jgi:segregation and condensation protein B